MQDPTIHYAAAIEAVRNAHERYNIAVQTLADAEEELERRTLNAMLEAESSLAAYMAHGSNETARKERRTAWVLANFGHLLDDVRDAKAEKATAEMELEHAKRLYRLEADRIKLLLAGYGGADLLGDEPPVGRLPADPRNVSGWEDEARWTNAEGERIR